MSKLTKEQWADIEKKLSGVFGMVDLLVDGHTITLSIQRLKMQLVIVVYVDGEIKGSWFTEEGNELVRRFYCPHQHYFLPAKIRARYKKMAKKWPDIYAEHGRTYTTHSIYWKSFPRLKAHLIKNNENIELVEEAHG